MSSHRRGFTLMEALVAIGVLLVLIAFLLLQGAVFEAREAARRCQCTGHLCQLCLALHNYHDVYGTFPPAYVADANGKPMHSWRVLIFPFIDQSALYNQYDFSEPWDGPNNAQLMRGHPMLPCYQCPSDRKHAVNYMAVIGKDTMWPGETSLTLDDVPDGTNNTIFVVEVTGQTSHWMKPVDLKFAELDMVLNAKEPGGISSCHPNIVHVMLVNGGYPRLKNNMDPEQLRRMLLRNDGLPVGNF